MIIRGLCVVGLISIRVQMCVCSLTTCVLLVLLYNTTFGRLSTHVGDEEDHSEHEAKGAHDDVADGQEVVLPAQQIGRAQHKVLASLERAHIKRVLDCQIIIARLKGFANFAVEFSEVGQASSAHPDDKVGVSHVMPLLRLPISVHVLKFVLAV